MKSKVSIAVPALESMTIEDLRATAKAAGIPVGKSKKNTIANLSAAIAKGTLHFKSQFTLSANPDGGSRTTFYGATLRTYKSGPGEENVVWMTPDTATDGSPGDPADNG